MRRRPQEDEREQQDRQRVFLAEIEQLPDLERREIRERKPVFLSVEQMPHRTRDRVLLQALADGLVLHRQAEVRQGTAGARVHAFQGGDDLVALGRG